MAIRSMTGFARVRRPIGDGEISLSVKSLNHRGLDIHFHLPTEFDPFEGALRTVIKRLIGRGHLEVRASIARARVEVAAALNRPLLAAYLGAFQEAAAEYDLNAEPDLNAALQLPGMLGESSDAEPPPGTDALAVEMLESALAALNEEREREGAGIAAVLRERVAAIRDAVARIAEIRTQALPTFQNRLRERLSDLLGAAGLEPQRLVQEAAILADRSDVGEELARLRIHADQLDELLTAGGEIGKRLDFLLQEMNRETNTVLSKTGGIGELGLAITELGIGLKADIEKVREQSLNLE
jgi:uncharacterized protein (TIGR00255 family)